MLNEHTSTSYYTIGIWEMLVCEYDVLKHIDLFVACPVKPWNVPFTHSNEGT